MREALGQCRNPPPGWWCSREPGHEGPCAALPSNQQPPPPEQPEMMSALRELEDAWAEYADWRADSAADGIARSFSLRRLEDARISLMGLINLPASPSSLKGTAGTIRATAIPGTLPDTAPFIWDDDPASATNEIPAENIESAIVTLVAQAKAVGIMIANDSRSLPTEKQRLEESEAALVALYANQQEEIERLKADNAAIEAMYKEVIDPLQDYCQRHHLGLGGEMVYELVIAECERLKASQLTAEEYALCHEGILSMYGRTTDGVPVRVNPLLAKLRSLSQPEP